MKRVYFFLLSCCWLIILQIKAQEAEVQALAFPNLPNPLVCEFGDSPESEIKVLNDSVLILTPAAKTNLFNGPDPSFRITNAAMALFEPSRNFVIQVRLDGNFNDALDVAGLIIFQDQDKWTKLYRERDEQGRSRISSVVTNRFSDESKSILTQGQEVWLAIVKKEQEFGFDYSSNGLDWTLIRHFKLNIDQTFRIGFIAHSQVGNDFSAYFTDVYYAPSTVFNLLVY